MKASLILLAAVLVIAVGCSSNSIFIGDTELSEQDLSKLLEGLPDTVRLVSAHESHYVFKEGAEAYSRAVVVAPGRTRIAGRVFKNDEPIVIDISKTESFARGESKKAGSDYFVYLKPSPVGKSYQAVVSRHHPDWKGYFSRSGGSEPREYSYRTWKLLGYFHVGPQGGILRNSVVTNSNLSDPPPGVPLPGMVRVKDFAIDIYENSDSNGHCVSVYGATPLTGVTRDEAQVAAGLAGKRLPTSKQWLAACDPANFPQVRSTKPVEGEGEHNTWSGQAALTGYFASQSEGNAATSGCVGMVGNVWEWCDEIVDFNLLDDMPVAQRGYITETGTYLSTPYWPAVVSTARAVESLGYFYIDKSLSQAGVARGGCFDDGDKAGPASLLLEVERLQPSHKVGLRCVR